MNIIGQLNVSGNINLYNGELIGTSSYSATASYIGDTVTASLAISASFSETASYLVGGIESSSWASASLSSSVSETASFAYTASYLVDYSPSSSWASASISASIADTASYAYDLINTASQAYSASYISGSTAILENLTVTNATITNLTVTYETSSILYSSGSTKFGDEQSDVHEFTGSVGITGSLQAPNITGSLDGTASFAVKSTNTENVTIAAKAAMAITKGQVVRVSGANGANVLVATASYLNQVGSEDTIGVALSDAANNATMSVLTFGVIEGINTNAFAAGDILYLGANGALTNVAPTAPLHTVRMGVVTRVNSVNGEVLVNVVNGFQIGELHDVIDSSTTASYGDLLVKSGSVWINSKNLTGSYGLSGSITMYQSASVSGTNIFGTASQADTASYVAARITKEWHVSSGSGNDTTGDGSILRPFKTLAKASSSLGNTGERVIIHPGSYTENITFSQLNFSITTPGDVAPGEVSIAGTLTFTGGSSSNKLGGFSVTSIVQSGNANLYLDSMTVTGTTTKSGTGYFEAQNSAVSQNSTITISNSGTCVFQGGKLGSLTQNNASSVVSILDCMSVYAPTATAGTITVRNSNVYALASGSNAFSAGAASVVFLQNSSFYNPAGGAERISVSGFYGFDDIIFNRTNSTFGTSLVARAHFQHIQADAITGSIFGSSSFASTASYLDGGLY